MQLEFFWQAEYILKDVSVMHATKNEVDTGNNPVLLQYTFSSILYPMRPWTLTYFPKNLDTSDELRSTVTLWRRAVKVIALFIFLVLVL